MNSIIVANLSQDLQDYLTYIEINSYTYNCGLQKLNTYIYFQLSNCTSNLTSYANNLNSY